MHSDLLYSEIYISNDFTHLERSIAAILQNSAMPWAWQWTEKMAVHMPLTTERWDILSKGSLTLQVGPAIWETCTCLSPPIIHPDLVRCRKTPISDFQLSNIRISRGTLKIISAQVSPRPMDTISAGDAWRKCSNLCRSLTGPLNLRTTYFQHWFSNVGFHRNHWRRF